MSDFPDAMPHGPIREVFPDVFFVTGTMRGEFFGSTWQFSRNMTVVREDGTLTMVNTVRLDEEGLAQLEALGTVKNVVRLGDMHGLDDRFYLDRYDADFWALPDMDIEDGITVDRELVPDGEMPFSDCTLFDFRTTARPEGILRLDRDGGIMIACDSLQNWVAPDEFFDESTVETMQGMEFFTPHNLGLAWLHASDPQAEDFVRLKEIPFSHALCGHGIPARNAMDAYHATFNRMFQV
ncbi:MAG: hypothetical protein EA351_12310 [Gemmatimonadales bacterium]|nr:MAG: hypothetical protein EA351_12310 [Gemmatimonadales bacterium]